jgi:CheY-like chemotaxis protein
MDNIANIITSFATLLWPVIVIVVLLIFRKSVRNLIDSASGRKFTVKIGEMELSMDDLSKQQAIMIDDLQKRVNELQKAVNGGTLVTKKESSPRDKVAEKKSERIANNPDSALAIDEIDDDISSILWVDDHPQNNALLIESLRKQGIKVVPAQSTQEAIERFKETPFSCVISDSCRHEGKILENCEAGVELARKLRDINDDMPIYLYTDKANPQLKQQAENAGATAVTSSPLELLQLLSD